MIYAETISAESSNVGGYNASLVPAGFIYKTNNTPETTTIVSSATPVDAVWTTTFKSSVSNLCSSPSNGVIKIESERDFLAHIYFSLSLGAVSAGLFADPQPALNGTVIDSPVLHDGFVSTTTPFSQPVAGFASTVVTKDDLINLKYSNRSLTSNINTFSGLLGFYFGGYV